MSIRDYFVAKQRELERRKRRDTAGKVGFGLALGALVGSAAGVLFAPKSGKETRKDIKDAVQETGEQIKATSKEFSKNVQKTYHDTVDKVSSFGEKKLTQLHNVAEDVEEKTEKALEKAKDKAEETKEKVEEKASEAKKGAAKGVEKAADKVKEGADKVSKKAEKESK